MLTVLKHRWAEADPSYSSLDAVFNGTAKEGRRNDPNYHHFRPGKERDNDSDVLTHAEA